MKRPKQIPPRPTLTEEELKLLASGARYIGSEEHKVRRWWGGLPKAKQLPGGRVGRPGKQHTTVCPLTSKKDQIRANRWIQLAIKAGNYVFVESDQKYPKKVWFEAAGKRWCGVCINTAAGEYKGWPSNDMEDYLEFCG